MAATRNAFSPKPTAQATYNRRHNVDLAASEWLLARTDRTCLVDLGPEERAQTKGGK